MSQLELKTATIFYEASEHLHTRPVVTLVNGHTRSSKDFRLLAKNLHSRGFATLSLDNRGSGQTMVSGPFSFEDMADDIIQLWRHLGISRSHLLGISMGGMICQRVAALHSDMVSGLILISTMPSNKWITPHASLPWGTSLEMVHHKLNYYFDPSFNVRNKLLVDAMAKQIFAAIREGTFSQDAHSQRKAMAAVGDLTTLDETISCPTLIIHGETDQIIDPEASRQLSLHIKSSRLELIKNCGHLLLAECPQLLYAMVVEFFSEP